MTTRICAVIDCATGKYARNLCAKHYRIATRGGELNLLPNPTTSVDTTWQTQAACRGHDPEKWFPLSERATTPAVAAARAVCARCPVREQCLEWALTELTAGIAGGLTTDERREIREGRKADAGQLVTAGGAR